jgi:hypothetical protein
MMKQRYNYTKGRFKRQFVSVNFYFGFVSSKFVIETMC